MEVQIPKSLEIIKSDSLGIYRKVMTFFESIVSDGDFFLTQWFDGICGLLKVYLQLFSHMMHTLTDLINSARFKNRLNYVLLSWLN